MTNDPPADDLPIFPTTAPEVFGDTTATKRLFAPVFEELATAVDVADDALALPTPCANYDVAALRRHVLAWLQFFAAALDDPAATAARPDPEVWDLGADDRPSELVRAAAERIAAAVDGGVADRLVVMSQARMAGDGVLAMALGEYLIHGWDLAVATGRPWSAADDAAIAALRFLEATVSPEFRGPDSGFFDAEVAVDDDASALDRLLCFAGRDPAWTQATDARVS